MALDLFEFKNGGSTFLVHHAVDVFSKFSMAEVVPNQKNTTRYTRSADSLDVDLRIDANVNPYGQWG
eukprot:8566263-Prorocentrum_lima.AAC.1